MQTHESYKSSGIQWISAIPKHWDAQRIVGYLNVKSCNSRPEDGVVTAFRDGQVTLRTNRRTEGFTNAIQEHGYQGIRVKATWSFMQWMHSRVQLAFRNRMVNQRPYTLRVSRVGNTQSIAITMPTSWSATWLQDTSNPCLETLRAIY